MNAVVTLLRGTQGIASAVPLDRAAEGKLLAPYLGTAVTPEELDLPRLIDVRIAAGGALDIGALRAKLTGAAPGTVLDDHQQWLDRLYALALSVEAAGLAIVAMVSAASVLTVVFTTRAGLAVHRDVIELLHMMGARDGYIARQFQREALRLGFAGGIGGLILAAVRSGASATPPKRCRSSAKRRRCCPICASSPGNGARWCCCRSPPGSRRW